MSNDLTGTPDPNARPRDANPVDPADPTAGMPEIDEHDPMIWTAPAVGSRGPGAVQVPDVPPVSMPTTAGGVAPVPTPIATTGQLPAVPMPHRYPVVGSQQGYSEAGYRPDVGADYPQSGYRSHPGATAGWTTQPAAWSTPQSTYQPNSNVHTVTPDPLGRPGRGRRSAAIIGAAVLLALAAGLGGGFLGARLENSGTASTVAAADLPLTQQSTSRTASSQVAADASIESVAAAVLPSVVSVVSTSNTAEGEGSGVILTQDGYILTNNHVIAGATDLTVRFNDGTTAKATVVGADATGDLAVIKVDGVSGLVPAALGKSGQVKVGEQVIAIGSPLGLSATVTSGIISALNRPVRTTSEQSQTPQNPRGNSNSTTASDATVLNAIQTDAAINPGNSGGPLVNMQGQIIGINSAIASLSTNTTSQSGSIGVGFAIPIDSAARIANEIIKTGASTHAVLGASVTNASDGSSAIPTGAQIKQLTSGGAAEAAGLQVGDVVTKVDGDLIESADALVATVRSAAPNSQVAVTLLRGTSTETVNITLGSSTN